jgi:O-antigen/teichoic acid export membrane protein
MYVLWPVLSQSSAASRELLHRRYDRVLYVMQLLALPIAIGGAMIGWRVLPALPGFAAFGGAGVALSILLPSFAMVLVGYLVQATLIAVHLQNRLLRISAAGLALNLSANAVLIPLFSYRGAAAADLATESLVVLLSAVELRKHTGLPIFASGAVRTTRATAVTLLAIGMGFLLPPLAQLGVALVAFGLAVPLTGALTRDDLRSVGVHSPRFWPRPLLSSGSR